MGKIRQRTEAGVSAQKYMLYPIQPKYECFMGSGHSYFFRKPDYNRYI